LHNTKAHATDKMAGGDPTLRQRMQNAEAFCTTQDKKKVKM